MNNQFDINNYPGKEPSFLVAGKRWVWKRDDVTEVYPTSEYTLKYSFVDPTGLTETRLITASKTNDKHVVEVSTANSNLFSGVDYLVSVEVERDSDNESITIDELLIEVRKANTGSYSQAYRTLMALRATIEGKASNITKSMSINGRSIENYSTTEIIELEREYTSKVNREKQKLQLKNGKKSNKRTRIRLGA